MGVHVSMSLHCGYISAFWGYPHIESHSNTYMWPKNPLRVTHTYPHKSCFKKLCFYGLKKY